MAAIMSRPRPLPAGRWPPAIRELEFLLLACSFSPPEVPGQPPLEAGGLAAQLPPSDLLHYSNLGMSMMLMREIPHNSIETK